MIKGSFYSSKSKRWLVPCATGQDYYEHMLPPRERTPIFSFDARGASPIDGAGDKRQHRIAIPATDMVTFPDKPLDTETTEGREDMCISSIQQGTERFAVLGNTFIKNAAIALDYGDHTLQHRRIGLGNRHDSGVLLDENFRIVRVMG